MMIKTKKLRMPLLMALLLLFVAAPLSAQIKIQCPCDRNGDGDCLDIKTSGPSASRYNEPALQASTGAVCMSLSGGDGFATMADGKVLYTFGFSNLTGTPEADVMTKGILAAAWPAPAIARDEGDHFYLNLSNVGMIMRPDLFDPHSVHFHGFPNASAVFDGLPESAIVINMGATLTYYYNLVDPGTFIYHCHVEATEHMQMGMLGNLYVRPGQNRRAPGAVPGHLNNGDIDEPPYGDWPNVAGGDVDLDGDGIFDHGTVRSKYVYNDGDGSTRYDVEIPLQMSGFDSKFHEDHINVQPLPFALMRDTYHMLNGRGYPDTANPNPLPAPAENGGIQSQVESSLVTATAGQKILLRLSNVNITVTGTLISPSIPMRVVGIDARELRDGSTKLHYTTNSIHIGGGQTADVILDTAGPDGIVGTADDIRPGRYFLYAANLNYLSNYQEDFGGMMTEIVIKP